MALILFDTNIFIDMLGGCHQASVELNSYPEPAISVITFMELRAGEFARPHEKALLDAVLDTFTVLPIDWAITDEAITVRGNSLLAPPKVKLPDAIIGATAVHWNIPLITRNPKDFKSLAIAVHVPYDYDSVTKIISNIRMSYKVGRPPIIMVK